MRCIDRCLRGGLAALGLVVGCTTDLGSGVAGSAASTASAATNASNASGRASRSIASGRDVAGAGTASHAGNSATTAAHAVLPLPAPHTVRSWNDVRLQAAERMVAADPGGTYTGVVPETLLAIPVLEIELNGDGSVRRITVLRHPRQAKDTTEMAIHAVRGAAPFGNVSRLPRPWRFVETFLFDEARRFKPRTLER